MTMPISRRSFVGATVAAGASALFAAGCSSSSSENTEKKEGSLGKSNTERKTVATYSSDVLVIGAGNSGLTACVQAADRGLGVVVLEKKGSVGGGGVGTEGMFAVGSSLQKASGIEVEPVEVIRNEMSYSHNRANGAKWLDLVHASGANLDWLIEKGVNFTGKVDTYAPDGELPVFHWFSENRAHADFTPIMYENAKRSGVKFLFNCPAVELIVDESGAVRGAYAEKLNGDLVRIDAKAVIMGTGGCSNNNEYLEEAHFTNTQKVQRFFYGYDGDGITMAAAVGGAKTTDKLCGLIQLSVEGVGGADLSAFGGGHDSLVRAARDASSLWVNQDGKRFVAENTGEENNMAQFLPSLTQQEIYAVFDAEMFEKDYAAIDKPLQETLEKAKEVLENRARENPYGDTFSSDTLEGLAKAIAKGVKGISEETILETMTSYNALCRSGNDTDFGKPEKFLVELQTPPFYFVQMCQAVNVTFGGVQTDSNFEVVDREGNIIENLYSIGVDSASDFWPNIYTRNVPAAINGHNINSGRTAANHAADKIGSAASGKVEESGDTSPSFEETVYEMPGGTLRDGVYSGTSTGMFGDITVTVEVSNGRIASASQTNQYETSYIGVLAMEQHLIPGLVESQDVNVDAVSGATMTSKGFCLAASAALKQAAE